MLVTGQIEPGVWRHAWNGGVSELSTVKMACSIDVPLGAVWWTAKNQILVVLAEEVCLALAYYAYHCIAMWLVCWLL